MPPVRAFIFVCGMILGAFALLSAQNLGFFHVASRAPERPGAPAAAGAEHEAVYAAEEVEPAQVERLRAALEGELKDPQGKNLDPLAVLLEEAMFERSWPKVQAAAESVRARGAEWLAPPVGPPPAPPEDRSLFELGQDYSERQAEVELASRRNRATLVARAKEPRANERLLEVLRMSASEQEQDDAAWLLARSGDERQIAELVRMLGDNAPALRRAAGRALAREGWLAGLKELCQLARTGGTLDVRRDAVQALLGYRSVLAGQVASGVQALVDALRRDESEALRALVAAGLAAADLHHVETYARALTEALERDDSAAVRGAAARSLAAATRRAGPPPNAIRAFEYALRTERAPENRPILLEICRDFGDQDTLSAIDAFAATPEAKAHGDAVAQAREELRARLAAAGAPVR